jgi:hypothetical protein
MQAAAPACPNRATAYDDAILKTISSDDCVGPAAFLPGGYRSSLNLLKELPC